MLGHRREPACPAVTSLGRKKSGVGAVRFVRTLPSYHSHLPVRPRIANGNSTDKRVRRPTLTTIKWSVDIYPKDYIGSIARGQILVDSNLLFDR